MQHLLHRVAMIQGRPRKGQDAHPASVDGSLCIALTKVCYKHDVQLRFVSMRTVHQRPGCTASRVSYAPSSLVILQLPRPAHMPAPPPGWLESPQPRAAPPGPPAGNEHERSETQGPGFMACTLMLLCHGNSASKSAPVSAGRFAGLPPCRRPAPCQTQRQLTGSQGCGRTNRE